jgi:hypothetical protein
VLQQVLVQRRPHQLARDDEVKGTRALLIAVVVVVVGGGGGGGGGGGVVLMPA